MKGKQINELTKEGMEMKDVTQHDSREITVGNINIHTVSSSSSESDSVSDPDEIMSSSSSSLCAGLLAMIDYS